ncbi:MAG: transcriptional regulator [Rhizobiaceae bacterium]|nr:transcriptional regulator [Rhizobiaceae bacterium]
MPLSDLEHQRARARGASLSRHYRSIGPAAIIAALMFQPQRKRSAA